MEWLLVIAGTLALVAWIVVNRRRSAMLKAVNERDARLRPYLAAIEEKILRDEPVDEQEILAACARPELRAYVLRMLRFHERPDLLPGAFQAVPARAEAELAYWLMSPIELGEAPELIEQVEPVVRPLDGDPCQFLVLRYRMPNAHPAATNGWLLGLAGPFRVDDCPFESDAIGYSRGDRVGEVSPAALVDQFIDLRYRQGRDLYR